VGLLISPDAPLADKTLVLINAYQCAKFQLPNSISFRDKEGVPKFNVGLLPAAVRWNFYVCSKYLARSNSLPNFSIVALYIMQLCEYVFAIDLPLYAGFILARVVRVKNENGRKFSRKK